MNSKPPDQRILLAEAALYVLRAYRDRVVIKFQDGERIQLQNLSWAHDDGTDFAEVIGNVDPALAQPQALRFFTNEVATVSDPDTGETVFLLPANLRLVRSS